jgi:hypothetical protein
MDVHSLRPMPVVLITKCKEQEMGCLQLDDGHLLAVQSSKVRDRPVSNKRIGRE